MHAQLLILTVVAVLVAMWFAYVSIADGQDVWLESLKYPTARNLVVAPAGHTRNNLCVCLRVRNLVLQR